MSNIKYFIFAAAMCSLVSSCSLEEENLHSLDSSNYFKGTQQFEELANTPYDKMRPLLRDNSLMWHGTDIYERNGVLDDSKDPINDYTVFSNSEGSGFWTNNYNVITAVNRAIDRGNNIAGVSAELKNKRFAELKALRAYAYFNLVEHFGGVPLLTSEITSPIYNFTRNSEEEIYNQIVSDLEDGATTLSDKAEAFGRVSAGMAKHLLAKVLLTRSYKSFAKSDDLSRSITYAKDVISKYPLSDWSTMFGSNYKNNNSEIIFSVRYSEDMSANGQDKTGNNMYQYFKFYIDQFPGIGRTADYGRPNVNYQPTDFYFNLYQSNDIRISSSYLKREIYASAEGEYNGKKIHVGDEIMYFPSTILTEDQKAAYIQAHPTVYLIVNPNEYHKYVCDGVIRVAFPLVWKFYDPNLTEYKQSDNGGTRDTYVFRTAATKMLLAEAYIKNDQADLATNEINDLRRRAGVALLTGAATIDDVLDESARELFGEGDRWMDLKRCGKLLERAQKYNLFAKKYNPTAIDSHYLLRPIPQNEIDLSSGSLTQNPGYAGAK